MPRWAWVVLAVMVPLLLAAMVMSTIEAAYLAGWM